MSVCVRVFVCVCVYVCVCVCGLFVFKDVRVMWKKGLGILPLMVLKQEVHRRHMEKS